jgi:mRNA interferase RelE/StbE
MKFKIQLIPGAEQDFKKLDGNVKKLVLKKLIQLESNPLLGEALGNKAGMDLTGYYKIYILKKKIRIIYEIKDEILIVRVISIGKRENFSVYIQSYLRRINIRNTEDKLKALGKLQSKKLPVGSPELLEQQILNGQDMDE